MSLRAGGSYLKEKRSLSKEYQSQEPIDNVLALPLVSIVILNYQQPQYTLNCLDSLEKLQYSNYQITVVDNHSEDDSIQRLSKSPYPHNLICSDENLGFSGGCNLGIEYALSIGADYVWLLNNDTLVKPDTLTCLLQKAKTTGGIVSSVLYYIDDPLYKNSEKTDSTQFDIQKARYQTVGVWFNAWNAQHKPIRESELTEELSPDSLPGASLLIPMRVIRRLGKLDESYFLYFEDSEFTYRTRKAGISADICLESKVYHWLGGTSGRRKNSYTYYYIFRNKYKFAFLVGNIFQKATLMMLALKHFLVRAAKCILNKPSRAAYHRHYLLVETLAFCDFMQGRYGVCRHQLPSLDLP